MEWLSNSNAWLIFGFLLLILEIVIPGIFIMWFGFAGLITAGVVLLFPALSFTGQLIVLAVFSTIFCLSWWLYQRKKDRQEDEQHPLNQRDHAMLGMRGRVVEILENGIARGKFGDTTWRVVGEGLKIGSTVEVVKVDGITLVVKVVA